MHSDVFVMNYAVSRVRFYAKCIRVLGDGYNRDKEPVAVPCIKTDFSSAPSGRVWCHLVAFRVKFLGLWSTYVYGYFFNYLIYLFIYFWMCWVFVFVRGLPLVVASGGHSSSWCAGLSLSRPLLLRSTGSRHAGSVVVAHGPSCSAACGILPDQGSNPCPLRWQADSQPLRHQGSPMGVFNENYWTW